MVNSYFGVDGKLGVKLGEATTDQKFALNEIVHASDGREYIYAKAGELITANYVVAIDKDGNAMKATVALADAGKTIAIAPVAVASGSYAFFVRRGQEVPVFLITATPAVPLYISTTAGKMTSTATSGMKINGIVATATASAAAVNCILTYPHAEVA